MILMFSRFDLNKRERNMEDKELDVIQNALIASVKHGLQYEVILSAINEIRANPTISTEEAFYHALYEWDI